MRKIFVRAKERGKYGFLTNALAQLSREISESRIVGLPAQIAAVEALQNSAPVLFGREERAGNLPGGRALAYGLTIERLTACIDSAVKRILVQGGQETIIGSSRFL